jgi:hypothetical protein
MSHVLGALAFDLCLRLAYLDAPPPQWAWACSGTKAGFPPPGPLQSLHFVKEKKLLHLSSLSFFHIFSNWTLLVELNISSVNFLATLHHPQRAYRCYLL